MWSFVGNKKQKQWLGLAVDRNTKEIVGFYLGDRSEEGALGLWRSLPKVYRQCAVCSTDFWSASEQIFPSKRHKSVGKAKQRGLGEGLCAEACVRTLKAPWFPP